MVGGTVIEVSQVRDGVMRLWCVDPRHQWDECAVHVSDKDGIPDVGDRVWWQGGHVYWTPDDERFVEKPLEKVGFSYDPRKDTAGKLGRRSD